MRYTMSIRFARFLLVLLTSIFTLPAVAEQVYDVVIYGGTSAAITAAVQVDMMEKSVIVVSPDKHLGGLSSGGLGFTDSGNKSVIGGLSRQFYHRVWKHYNDESAWKWQKKAEYGNKGQGTPAIDKDERTMWIFEPHVAEKIFDEWVIERKIPVIRNAWLDREKGVVVESGRIKSITTLDGKTYRGKMFIDATYEGDLMAAAGVSYHVGRESTKKYGEKWNGVQTGVLHHSHWFRKPIDPYVIKGDKSSGLLPRISPDPPGEYGAGDHRVQAYCFRMCLTNVPENRVPFPKPEGYDPKQYELLVRVYESGWRGTFGKFDPIPNRKTDTNNHGPFSTDNIGMNYDYPEASYERRREIIKEHETYQKGLMYFTANDERVPEEIRTRMSQWGLAKDEFTDNGNWPHQIYVREARRMVGKYVMTEHDCLVKRETPESVGMGSYTMDSHNVQRYVKPDGYVQNEGDIGVHGPPYRISYGSLVPKEEECTNLLVPVACSSSHIAFGSIRMDPVFMILGQSAATAAVMSIDADVAVQKLPYEKLRERLLADGQVLEYAGSVGKSAERVDPKTLAGIVLDDRQAKKTGQWLPSTSTGRFLANSYLHDNDEGKGKKHVVFAITFDKAERYDVRLAYTPNPNRATNVPVTVTYGDAEIRSIINQRKQPPIDDLFVSLGKLEVRAGDSATVSISNEGTDGYVIVDGVQFVPVK